MESFLQKTKFDWEKFLINNFPNGRVIKTSGKKEYQMDCISEYCPNPRKHMYVNIFSENPKHDRKFFCHRCDFRGDWKAFLVHFYKQPLNQILSNQDSPFLLEKNPFLSTKEMLNQMSKNFEYSPISDFSFKNELPKGRKILSHTKFTKRRKIPMRFIKKLNIYICDSGFFKGRLIFPIKTKKSVSFLAYSQLNKKALSKWKELYKKNPESKTFYYKSKKVFYPSGSMINLLLYNYNNISKNQDLVFLVEGSLDCIRILSHGFKAVAYLKGTISEHQADLLNEKRIKEVCFMPDSDIFEEKNKEKFHKNINILRENFEGKVTYIRLKSGDPDDIKSRKQFLKIIKHRKKATKDYLVDSTLTYY